MKGTCKTLSAAGLGTCKSLRPAGLDFLNHKLTQKLEQTQQGRFFRTHGAKQKQLRGPVFDKLVYRVVMFYCCAQRK